MRAVVAVLVLLATTALRVVHGIPAAAVTDPAEEVEPPADYYTSGDEVMFTEEEEEGEPSEYFLQVVTEQLEEARANANSTDLGERTRRSHGYHVAIYQGDRVALQNLFEKRYWLSCEGNPCVRATCPKLYMEGSDWTRCLGEVFQIYRLRGPGTVRVGDIIGLHYPRGHGNWFSCGGGEGHKATCPGSPSTARGFQYEDLWFRCWGEVFRIYARGKNNGDLITSHDHIMLYYIQVGKWVGIHYTPPRCAQVCPGTPPPSSGRYECYGEVMEIWKQ